MRYPIIKGREGKKKSLVQPYVSVLSLFVPVLSRSRSGRAFPLSPCSLLFRLSLVKRLRKWGKGRKEGSPPKAASAKGIGVSGNRKGSP